MKPTNHKELHDYLLTLAARFDEAHVKPVSEALRHAACTATTIPVTEFLGETLYSLIVGLSRHREPRWPCPDRNDAQSAEL